jgi:hypothetical protein
MESGLRVVTPLCPAGHLPLKGGDWLGASARASLSEPKLAMSLEDEMGSPPLVFSPLEGEMPGRAEGGTPPVTPTAEAATTPSTLKGATT